MISKEVEVSTGEAEEKYSKHEIESASDTLARAEEIKADSELFALCQEHMGKKAGHIQSAMGKKPGSLKELKQIAKNKEKAEMMEE